jgi:hypothetical protein
VPLHRRSLVHPLLIGHLLDDRRLPHLQVHSFGEEQIGEIVDSALNVVDVAMKTPDFSQDFCQGIVTPFRVGQEKQVVLGEDAIGQPNLIEQQLERRLEAHSVEFELDRVVRGSILPPKCCDVEHHRKPESPLEMRPDLFKRCRLCEWESVNLEQCLLDQGLRRFRVGRTRASLLIG